MTDCEMFKRTVLYLGTFFCFSFSCGENWHDPVKCKWLKKWIKKCDDDSETSNWIAANTKVGVSVMFLVCQIHLGSLNS